LKAFTTYLLGMSQVKCFKTHNKLTMYPLGKLPFAPSERDAELGIKPRDEGEQMKT